MEIKKKINESKYSSSKPIFDPSDERAVLRPNFDSRDRFEMHIGAIENYVLKTDVSRFFHSIYTHSISWAAHGKDYAKKNRSYNDFGNLLDLLVRNSQDGQTIGLPVGPDTSRVISELIGSALDVEIRKSLPRGVEAIRFVDDYIVGVPTREVGERYASLVRKILTEFELDINHRKTGVYPSGLSHLNGWKEEVRSLAPIVPFQDGQLERFFYGIESIAKRDSDKNVYLFALSRLRFSFLRDQDWRAIEDHILPIARLDPSLIAPVCDIVITRNTIKPITDCGRLEKFATSLVKNLVSLRNYGELTWILHMCIRLKIKISSRILRPLFDEENPFIAILICDLDDKGLVKGSLKRSHWNTFLNEDGLHSHMWLYAYEATLKGFTKKKNTNFLKNHKYFKYIFEKEIEFYRSSGQSLSLRELMLKASFNWQVRRSTLNFGEDLDMDADLDFEEEDLEDATTEDYV
ncbi:RNA-directed DNA polymerase [Mesorhizobium sp. STM 4661]|uniref:RNA-directed DNA polymerase n=1 Tax=Mesorhizobium sp. STM 4661 TaxID=1297570 RepID=UPI0012F9D9D8|nr:RNA-directed DNA polymerase [Mesorhizobium sp. STM 4661]